jgi:hypothetical protein
VNWNSGGGEGINPNWFISDGEPGTHAPVFDTNSWFSYPKFVESGGPWRALDTQTIPAPHAVYQQILHSLETGESHPLDGGRTLTVQSVISAAYQSGLKQAPISFDGEEMPDKFPLQMPSTPTPEVPS